MSKHKFLIGCLIASIVLSSTVLAQNKSTSSDNFFSEASSSQPEPAVDLTASEDETTNVKAKDRNFDASSQNEYLDSGYSENIITYARPIGGIESGKSYVLKNAYSSKYLDVDHAGNANNTNVLQWGFNGQDNQVWKITMLSNYCYTLAPQHAPNMRLAVLAGDSSNGSNVGLLTADLTDTSQQWEIVKSSNENYILKSRCSNSSKVLTVEGASHNNGANVFQYSYSSGSTTNDEWNIEPLIHLRLEYDFAYWRNTPKSDDEIQSDLTYIGEQASKFFNDEFGIKMRISSGDFTSLGDNCDKDRTKSCIHGDDTECTNSYMPNSDEIHHKNMRKMLNLNAYENRWKNAINVDYSNHNMCRVNNNTHQYFSPDTVVFGYSLTGRPYAMMNRTLDAGYINNYCLIVHEVSHCYGAPDHSARNCIMGKNISDAEFVRGYFDGTYNSFWCDSCRDIIQANKAKHSN